MGFISSLLKGTKAGGKASKFDSFLLGAGSDEPMNFIGKSIFGAGKFIGKNAIGSAGRRMALGGFLGGAYQVLTSDANDTTNYLEDIAGGVLGGALIGGASRAITPAFSGGKLHKPWLMRGKLVKNIGRAARLGKTALNTAYSAASFGMRHPYLTLGTIGGGYALSQASSAPIYTSDYGTGYGSQYNHNQRFMQSTQGLVQGMHHGRH